VGFPSSLHLPEKGKWRSLQIRMHRDRRMAAVHWYDTKGVHFLSTAADPVELYGVTTLRRQGGCAIDVPTSPIQLLYTENMRGVDTQDQYRAAFSTQIFTKKWWHRMYFFGFDSALTNTFIIHKTICISRGQKFMEHGKFQLAVAQALMERPLPRDFGMPSSQCTSTSRGRSGDIERGEGSSRTAGTSTADCGVNSDEPADIPLSQESMNAAIPECHGDGEGLQAPELNLPISRQTIEGDLQGPIIDPRADEDNKGPPIRRRRPNLPPRRPRPAPALLQNNEHYSKKGWLRRVCRQCRRRTTWICPGCQGLSLCPEECFLSFHRRHLL
jgi:hypothetical protein